MIATRWVGVGQDTYMCDCVFPLYNPASMAYSKQFSMRKDRWVENKVSLLAFTEFEHRLEENIWYSRLESLSNGLSPDIISEAEFATIVDRPLGGNNRNPNGGTAIPNITIVRSNNHDPIFFANFIELGNQIGTRTYTDENGDTYFSRMKKAFEKSPQRVRDEAYKAFNEGKKWSEFAHIIVNGQKRCSLMYDYASEFKMVEEIKAIWGLKYQGKIDVNIAKERILPYKGMSVEERYKKQITDHLFSNALNWLRKNNYKHIILEIFPDYKFEKGASKFKVISDNELLEKIVDIIKQTTFSNVEVISRELNRQNISGGKKKIETLMQSKQFKKLVGNNKINIKNKLTNSQLISKIRKIKKQYNTTSYDKIAKVLRECGFSISNTRVKEQCDKVFKK